MENPTAGRGRTHTQIKVGFMATQMIVTSALALVLVTAPRAHASLLSAVRQRDARSRQQPARNRAIHSNGASYWRLRARRRRAPRAPGWLAAVSATPEGRGGGRAADVACSRRSALRGGGRAVAGLVLRGGCACARWCVRAVVRTCVCAHVRDSRRDGKSTISIFVVQKIQTASTPPKIQRRKQKKYTHKNTCSREAPFFHWGVVFFLFPGSARVRGP